VIAIPRVTREERPWQQTQRAGTRADRLVRSVMVTIPPPLAAMDLSIPSSVAGELDAAARAVVTLDAGHGSDLSALSGLLLRTESVASSKIEYLDASIDDYARALHGARSNESAVAMVAASTAMERLMASVTESRHIALNDLLDAHRSLMADDPMERGHAGRVRDVQNWVGGSDYSPRNALLVPPPPDLLAGLLDDLLIFANRADVPSLLQATVAHAQFETLHPFTDGNGRLGRALVNAILRARGTTTKVVVPIASALVARRDEYFSALDAYREGDLEPILKRFTEAALIAAEEASVTAERIRQLPDEWREGLGRTRQGSAPMLLVDYLLTQPVINAADVQASLGVRTSVAYAAIERLESAGVIRPLTDRERNQVWGASALMDELSDLDTRIQSRARR
jgi:Fic family protein